MSMLFLRDVSSADDDRFAAMVNSRFEVGGFGKDMIIIRGEGIDFRGRRVADSMYFCNDYMEVEVAN